MEGEEPHPELTLIHEYDDPNQDIYEPDGKVQSHHTIMNTGNVVLTAELAADGVDEENAVAFATDSFSIYATRHGNRRADGNRAPGIPVYRL